MKPAHLIPTLDELVTRPELATQLPLPAVQRLLYQAMAVQQACFTVLLVGESSPRNAGGDDRPADELISAQTVAAMMGGISARAVYRQARQFPFSTFAVRPTLGTVRFRRSLVVEYLRDPDAYRVRHSGAAASGPAAPVRRMGR